MITHKRTVVATALTAGLLLFPLSLPTAEAKDIFIAGTAPPGANTHVSDGDYTWITGKPVTDEVYIVQYPRALAPLTGSQMLWQSVNAGAADARPHLENGDTVLAVSQGALVAENLKQWAVREGITNLTIITYGDPINHDGGFLAKVWGVPTAPIIKPTPVPEGYQQITYAIEYDIVADSPDVELWKNPLAWANSAMAGIYDHASYSQAYIEKAAAEGRLVRTEDEYGVHYLIKQTNLPLTRPLRQVEKFLTGQTALTDGLDRVLEPIINGGYTGDRTTALPPGPAPVHGVPESVPGESNPAKSDPVTGSVSGNVDTTVTVAHNPKVNPVKDLAEKIKDKLDAMKGGNKFSPGDTVADRQEQKGDDNGTPVTDEPVQKDPEVQNDPAPQADNDHTEADAA